MTVTRQPTGQDLVCLVCHKQAQDIDHVVNRGSGGSKARDVPENKVPLCRECHELKTLGRIETTVMNDVQDGQHYYYQWRKKDADVWIGVRVEVSQRYKCLVGMFSDGAEGNRTPDPSASSLKEESDGLVHGSDDGSGAGDGDRGDLGERRLTHDQRVAIAAQIKDTEWNRQWIAGDTANAWRAEINEEAEQYIDDFGYVQESIANIMRVCERIPKAMRRPGLRFSHHVVVVGGSGNLEDIDEALAECEREGWSVAEFRRQVKGERPRVKRYSPGEIHDLADEYPFEPARNEIRDFADWLGQRDGNDGLAD